MSSPNQPPIEVSYGSLDERDERAAIDPLAAMESADQVLADRQAAEAARLEAERLAEVARQEAQRKEEAAKLAQRLKQLEKDRARSRTEAFTGSLENPDPATRKSLEEYLAQRPTEDRDEDWKPQFGTNLSPKELIEAQFDKNYHRSLEESAETTHRLHTEKHRDELIKEWAEAEARQDRTRAQDVQEELRARVTGMKHVADAEKERMLAAQAKRMETIKKKITDADRPAEPATPETRAADTPPTPEPSREPAGTPPEPAAERSDGAAEDGWSGIASALSGLPAPETPARPGAAREVDLPDFLQPAAPPRPAQPPAAPTPDSRRGDWDEGDGGWRPPAQPPAPARPPEPDSSAWRAARGGLPPVGPPPPEYPRPPYPPYPPAGPPRAPQPPRGPVVGAGGLLAGRSNARPPQSPAAGQRSGEALQYSDEERRAIEEGPPVDPEVTFGKFYQGVTDSRGRAPGPLGWLRSIRRRRATLPAAQTGGAERIAAMDAADAAEGGYSAEYINDLRGRVEAVAAAGATRQAVPGPRPTGPPIPPAARRPYPGEDPLLRDLE